MILTFTSARKVNLRMTLVSCPKSSLHTVALNKNHKWFDFHVSKNIFLSVEYRMLSYLLCGLCAERSYMQRKAHIIRFFFLIYVIMRAYFFLHKINKAYSQVLQNISIQKIQLKTFSGIKHSTFQN